MANVYLQPGNAPGIHTVPAERAMQWLQGGWRQFLVAPGVWIALSLALLVIHFGLALVPVVGSLAAVVLTPVLAGGLMAGCAAIDRGEPLRFDHLFAGFRTSTGRLATVGIVQLIVIGAIVLLIFLVGGGAMVGGVMGHGVGVGATVALGGLLLAAMLGLLLLVPLTMALWFAPALVMLSDMAALDAMKASFAGCLRNWLPFLVYSLVLCVLLVLVPLTLGLALLAFIPVMTASIYLSYRDIFH